MIEGPLETALRWDQVADLAYGDPFDYERLIRASLALAITPVLEPGDVIVAPVLAEASTPSAGLPPWKRP
ncbi:MAG: hypothetical protein EAZ99_04030 [Alphaproteobacteria bacterium]|nr:MAG: hypothetical protein EAZ99_04030 [Alphaproteobacteria bacterium]